MSSLEKDIIEYLLKNGYDIKPGPTCSHGVYCGGSKSKDSIFGCQKGIKNGLEKIYKEDNNRLNKYLLDFIGPILRKHNITKFICNSNQYTSNTWRFDDIS